MSLSICLIIFFYQIYFRLFHYLFYFYFLIWYNNFIINIKLLIKSDVDSNFKFQFNQIFPHLSCSSFNIFHSLSLFLALNLFVLYYLLGFFYIFRVLLFNLCTSHHNFCKFVVAYYIYQFYKN